MEIPDSEFKKDFRQKLHQWSIDYLSLGSEKYMYESIIIDFYNKMDKHQKRKIKMLCEIYTHQPLTK